jgi:hypothetical protein
MGLTIHYSLQSNTSSIRTARQLVNQLRQKALDLPFKAVGPLVDLSGQACDFDCQPRNCPHRWLLIQAGGSVEHGPYSYTVPPRRLIAFETHPGDGCEAANFGLCLYPASIQVIDRDVHPHRQRRLRTGRHGWLWSSFCKTQYASNPNHGGVRNFLRCHLLVICLLEEARNLGILQSVSDEGDCWQKRDIKALAQEVGQWNEMIAAEAGQLKDLLGEGLQAEILKYPDYEHLEAAGQVR